MTQRKCIDQITFEVECDSETEFRSAVEHHRDTLTKNGDTIERMTFESDGKTAQIDAISQDGRYISHVTFAYFPDEHIFDFDSQLFRRQKVKAS